MTFTYNLAAADAAAKTISRVRLELGDTIDGAGVRPDATNLEDEEIAVWLEREDNDVMRATACACEALARMWATLADTTLGPRKDSFSQVSARWAERGKQLRENTGGTTSASFGVPVSRQDGYSQ